MFLFTNDPFVRAFTSAFVGALIGLVCGLFFGFLILGVGLLLGAGETMGISNLAQVTPPLMLAMGFGSLMGALLGGFVAIRRKE